LELLILVMEVLHHIKKVAEKEALMVQMVGNQKSEKRRTSTFS
jgi:hypothetical protein